MLTGPCVCTFILFTVIMKRTLVKSVAVFMVIFTIIYMMIYSKNITMQNQLVSVYRLIPLARLTERREQELPTISTTSTSTTTAIVSSQLSSERSEQILPTTSTTSTMTTTTTTIVSYQVICFNMYL